MVASTRETQPIACAALLRSTGCSTREQVHLISVDTLGGSIGTLGVVTTCGQATKKLHVLTEQGTVRVDGDQRVQVLAAKLLIQLAQTVSALDQMDGP